jgi:hypothetical protein
MRPDFIIDTQGILYVTYHSRYDGEVYYVTNQGSSWISPVNVSRSMAISLDSSLTIDPGGDIQLGWTEVATGSSGIYYSRLRSGGWSIPTVVHSSSEASSAPSLEADHEGHLHITWIERTGPSSTEVYYVSGDGDTWSSPISITGRGRDYYNPSVSVDVSGRVHIVWVDRQQRPSTIWHRWRGGTVWSAPVEVSRSTGWATNPSLAADLIGGIHTVWTDSSPGHYGRLHSYWSDLSWSQPVTMPHPGGLGRSDTAVDALNRLHVISDGLSADNYELFYALWDDNVWREAYQVTSNPGSSYSPAIAIDPRGTPHIVWSDWDLTFPFYGILYSYRLEMRPSDTTLYLPLALHP